MPALNREAHRVLLLPPLERGILQEAHGAHERHDDDTAGHHNDVFERDRAGLLRSRRFASFTIVTRLAIADVIFADSAVVALIFAHFTVRPFDLAVVLIYTECFRVCNLHLLRRNRWGYLGTA